MDICGSSFHPSSLVTCLQFDAIQHVALPHPPFSPHPSPVIWWIFLLAFNSMPLSISLDLYWLFLGVVAWNPQYWLYVLLVPVACILPDFFFRNVRRCVCVCVCH